MNSFGGDKPPVSVPTESRQPHELRFIPSGFDCKCGKWSTDLLAPANGLRKYADHLESLLRAELDIAGKDNQDD